MPVLKSYLHGFTLGTPPAVNCHPRSSRSDCRGWSESSTRTNKNFLKSIPPESLNGYGFAFTLTVRDIPATPAAWASMRHKLMKRMARDGMFRCHWLTEWQMRKAPHLHGCVWYPDYSGIDPKKIRARILNHWLAVAGVGVLGRAQVVKPITDAVGWFQYLAKHASRGLSHYQRNPANIPPAWKGKTGRMWGYWGSWQIEPPLTFDTTFRGGFMLRRIARAWRIADARASGDRKRIRSARGMLRCPERHLSPVRGVSEWIPQSVVQGILLFLASEGEASTARV
jgi:hypothetical protein